MMAGPDESRSAMAFGVTARTLIDLSIEPTQLDHQRFEPFVVLVLGELAFLIPQGGDGQFDCVAAMACLGGDRPLAIAGDQVELVGADAVGRGAVLGAAGGADAAEPVGRRAQPVAVVVEQRVLGGQLRAGAVILRDAAGSRSGRLPGARPGRPCRGRPGVGDRLGRGSWPNRA